MAAGTARWASMLICSGLERMKTETKTEKEDKNEEKRELIMFFTCIYMFNFLQPVLILFLNCFFFLFLFSDRRE